MKTVKEVSALTGVSIRTLHHYDAIGLLRPTRTTEAGYRLYDDRALERLQLILLFRALEFPLKEIREILDSPGFNRNRALEQQIELLRLRREHIQNLIDFARGIQMIGVNTLDFSAFDTKKLDDYAAQAKAVWGTTPAWQEFEAKSAARSPEEEQAATASLLEIFERFGAARALSPEEERVQKLVSTLQSFISEHFYTCTPKILAGLGRMYAGGGSLTESIDQAGGPGTAAFVRDAIQVYCGKNR